MDRIASFCVDHNALNPGMYISRIDGDITTYDLRLIKPNTPPFMENAAMHTIEHLFATYARNCEYKDHVIYFGPMGCRTGFYFLTRNLPDEKAMKIVRDGFHFIADFCGDIPGTKPEECGNYKEHDLVGAVNLSKNYIKIVDNLKLNDINY